MVIRSEAKANTIENLFDVCNRIFKDDDCFYTNEELEQKKRNKNNIFIRKENSKNGRNEHFSKNECYN